ncbi:MAG: hypothetical protein Q9169_008372 [Polycauliona sp. 2 TL-2023]
MEQISMPVLNVARAKEVTPETIISPIEQRSSQNTSNSPMGQSPFSQHPSMQNSLPSSISPFGSMNRNTIPPMNNDLAGPYTPMQAGFYDNEPMSQFHRNQPSTYPPPVQQPTQSNYTANRGAPYNMSSYNSYDSAAASNQFVPINPPTPRTNYQFSQSTSPEALYTGGMRPPPTSQPRTTSFAQQQQQSSYPTSTTYPQQGQFPTSNDHYGYHQSSNSPPYSQAQGRQSIEAQVAMTYGQIEDLTFPQQQQQGAVRGMYGQQHQQQQHQGGRGGYGY